MFTPAISGSCKRIVQEIRPLRHAYIEHFEEPVSYGIHTTIADFYEVKPKDEYPSTPDHFIGAVGGGLTGTFAGALAARGIELVPGELVARVEGDIEKMERTMKITEIRVR